VFDTRWVLQERNPPCLKLDKPLGTIYLSHKPHPIIVANTALSETTRADEIAIETTKTGKVTAVVAAKSIFSKKRYKAQNANLRNKKPSHQKAESANFLVNIAGDQDAFLRKQEKARYQRN
jgi:hypothetical protein